MLALMPAPSRDKKISVRASTRVASAMGLLKGRLGLSRDTDISESVTNQTVLNALVMYAYFSDQDTLEKIYREGLAHLREFDADGYRLAMGQDAIPPLKDIPIAENMANKRRRKP